MNDSIKKPQIVDVSTYIHKKQRQPEKGFQPKEDLSNPRQYPLEMQPVLDAVIEYSRKTFALGLLTGAEEIEAMIAHLDSMNPKNAQISQIINLMNDKAMKLREGFKQGYGM